MSPSPGSGLDLDALARDGNVELALDLLEHQERDPSGYAARAIKLRQARSPDAMVLVPLVAEPPLLTSVRIVAGLAPDPWGDQLARDAAQRAISDAWRDLGGPGVAPPCTPALGIGTARRVQGPSAYLAIYLAAVAYFGEQPLAATVLATGDFSADLDGLAAKDLLAKRAATNLGVSVLLYASRIPAATLAGLHRVNDRAELRRLVFHLDPWHPEAPHAQIQVCCGDCTPPKRFDNPTYVRLPATLTRQDLPDAIRRFREALHACGHDRAELAVKGPQPLAASLGIAARNALVTVRIIDAVTNEPVWDNRCQRRPLPDSSAIDTAEARVVLTAAARDIPAGWQRHEVREAISRRDMPEAVAGFLRSFGRRHALHLASATTLPMAWAIAGMRRNQPGVTTYYHLTTDDHGASHYQPWFQDRGGEPEIRLVDGTDGQPTIRSRSSVDDPRALDEA